MKEHRKDAIAAKEPLYYTSKPCKYGHYAPRHTIDGACTQCRTEHTKQERASIRLSLQTK